MPECTLTEEELGLEKLNAVLPDTWQNISWVLQNSVRLLIERAKIDARAIEEIKAYTLRENQLSCENFMDFLEKGNEDLVRIETLIG